jgi:hypothetical protein
MSIALQKQISASMNGTPLKQGEARGIEGMGSHFFSLQPTHNGRDHLFAGEVNGYTVYIFKVAEEVTESS